MKIAMASDHGGYRLKEVLKKNLLEQGYEVEDFGCYNEESCEMTGEATGRTFKLGMPVKIEVEDCDRFMRTINFRLVDE